MRLRRRAVAEQVNPNGDQIGTGRRHESGKAGILVGPPSNKTLRIPALGGITTLESLRYQSLVVSAVEPTGVAAKGQPARNGREIKLENNHLEGEPTP